MGGFRLFHNHDPRAIESGVNDPRCAKIVLTRNPADSYVSWKIAQETGQWKLTNVKRRKDAKATSMPPNSSAIANLQPSRSRCRHASSGRARRLSHVSYEDLKDSR